MRTESVREFQKNASKYLKSDEVILVEDAKSHTKKGVYIPYGIYQLFEKELQEAIRKEIARSFGESFDGVGVVHDA
jgi:uncharacterized protein (DUF2344 family)